MKKLAFLSLFLVIASTGILQAQNGFTLSELMSFCTLSDKEFDTQILEHGFSYWSMFSGDGVIMYRADVPGSDGIPDQITYSNYGGLIPPVVTFATTNKQIHLAIVKNLDSKGFKSTKDVDGEILGEKMVQHFYSNGTYTFVTYVTTNNNGEIVWYNFQIY